MSKKAIICLYFILAIGLSIVFGYWLGDRADPVSNIPVIINDQEYEGKVVWSHKDSEIPKGYTPFWYAEVSPGRQDVPITSLECYTAGMTFGDNVGRIFWDKGIMEFEGNAKESAKIFFEVWLKPYIDEYIESEMEKKELIEVMLEEPEMILFRHVTSGEFAWEFKPTIFLEVVNTDLSRCLIGDRLRLDLNGKIYWLRLEEDE